ncbi:Rv3654c family TadE-like protein [Actinophytocola sp. KF-1]
MEVVPPVAEACAEPLAVGQPAPHKGARPGELAGSGQPEPATPTASRDTGARTVRAVRRARRGSARRGHPSWDGCDERSADRGAATVWVVGGLAVLMAVMTGVLWFGSAVVARHQAEAAADLGALAAAVEVTDGERAACAEARWVVEQMGGVLRSCRLSGWDALVEAEVAFGPFGSAAGRARAGPVEFDG